MNSAAEILVTASLVERVGAYVGFAAFLGLAILALLYFSQARDVRRLREWAGRAPERAAELEQRPVPTTPAAQTPTVVRKPLPAAGTPVAAQTAAGKAGPLPATPAGAAAAASNGADEETSESTEAAEVAASTTADQPTVAHTPVLDPLGDEQQEEDDFSDLEPLEPLPREHYLPGASFGDARPRKPLHQRARNIHIPQLRYVAAAIAVFALLVFGVGSVTGLIGGDDSGSGKSEDSSKQAKQGSGTAPANVDPSQVTVAVLNGTTVTGLAFKVSQEAKAASFTLGNVTNAATTDQPESEVLFAPGQRNAARAVADRLGITTVAPVDSVNAEIAGSADAIVLVGSDRSG